MTSRRVLGLALVVILLTAPVAVRAAHPWTTPRELRIGLIGEPNTLNPLFVTQTLEDVILRLCFDRLFDAHPDGSLTPDLARRLPTRANGGISADGRTIVIRLRPGVRWHDGAAFTSGDVAFTQAAHLNPRNDVPDRSPFDLVRSIATPNATTVVVQLARPQASFLAQWGTAAILPAHLLARLPDLDRAPFGAAPVGTGPFVFERWDRSRELTFRANLAYAGGAPKLRRIVVRFFGDANAAAVAVRAHDVDLLFNAPPSVRDVVRGDPTLRIVGVDANGVVGMYANLASPPLDDVRVRRAIDAAIDRRTLARTVLRGSVAPAAGLIPATSWAADRSRTLPDDPARSRALLAGAGWRPAADGVRSRDGRRLSFTLVYPAGLTQFADAALLLQADLRAVGIALALKAVEPNLLYAPASEGGTLQTGAFQLALGGFIFRDDPDSTILFGCASVAPHGFDVMRYCSPRYDVLTARANAIDDRAVRAPLYAAIDRELRADAPEAFLWWIRLFWIAGDDLHGFADPIHHDIAAPERWSLGG